METKENMTPTLTLDPFKEAEKQDIIEQRPAEPEPMDTDTGRAEDGRRFRAADRSG